ncbi:hypothetical protein B9479_004299 [Cryptococcus floricola]|uniref:Uncharacterized protein n=1 Tax=Cryptococcus floricola TaxID=2591691 RepID=A0A5D3AW61_9TREE|nr:hypothetical protein B9479_004299 [Cryptococcus floricola]
MVPSLTDADLPPHAPTFFGSRPLRAIEADTSSYFDLCKYRRVPRARDVATGWHTEVAMLLAVASNHTNAHTYSDTRQEYDTPLDNAPTSLNRTSGGMEPDSPLDVVCTPSTPVQPWIWTNSISSKAYQAPHMPHTAIQTSFPHRSSLLATPMSHPPTSQSATTSPANRAGLLNPQPSRPNVARPNVTRPKTRPPSRTSTTPSHGHRSQKRTQPSIPPRFTRPEPEKEITVEQNLEAVELVLGRMEDGSMDGGGLLAPPAILSHEGYASRRPSPIFIPTPLSPYAPSFPLPIPIPIPIPSSPSSALSQISTTLYEPPNPSPRVFLALKKKDILGPRGDGGSFDPWKHRFQDGRGKGRRKGGRVEDPRGVGSGWGFGGGGWREMAVAEGMELADPDEDGMRMVKI